MKVSGTLSYSKSEHYGQSVKKKVIECDKCQYKYKNNNNLKKHVELVHVKPIHKEENSCDKCRIMFKSSSDLNHMITHSTDKCYVCLTCKKSFKAMKLLKTHEKNNHKEENYSFDKCRITFNSSSDLNNHMITHLHYSQR